MSGVRRCTWPRSHSVLRGTRRAGATLSLFGVSGLSERPTKLAGACTQFVEHFFRGVADENERSDFASIIFAPDVSQMRLSAAAIDARH
jgi:hypothetical protein